MRGKRIEREINTPIDGAHLVFLLQHLCKGFILLHGNNGIHQVGFHHLPFEHLLRPTYVEDIQHVPNHQASHLAGTYVYPGQIKPLLGRTGRCVTYQVSTEPLSVRVPIPTKERPIHIALHSVQWASIGINKNTVSSHILTCIEGENKRCALWRPFHR